MKLKITRVEVMPPTRLRVTWDSGKQSEVDVGEYVQAPGHERLRDPVFFADVQMEEWGHGVEWSAADIGIPAQALYRLSKEQSGDAFPTAEFNAWMERHGLSLSAAARALHLTRRTIIYYSTGAKPIPAYIGLACRGWEAAQRKHVA
ncbi:MAG: DUF2442 domain-containing protein [Steroidobacteraceae bacterium]